MNQEEYDLEHHAIECEFNRRMDLLSKRSPFIHQEEYADREQKLEVWYSRQVDRLDERFMEAA